ncbi:MAG: hypothetical protein JWQ43_1419 [Glaciihabitans sp.]|nr:hypothetical protein [Glaciihabitans sp.]
MPHRAASAAPLPPVRTFEPGDTALFASIPASVQRSVQACVGLWLEAVESRDGETPDAGMAERVASKFQRPIVRFAVLGEAARPIGFALTTVATCPNLAQDLSFAWPADAPPEPAATPTLERFAYLELLAVDPAMQGHGAGRVLLNDAIAAARNQGFRRLELDVRIGNDSAIHLYESLGMVATGSRPTAHAVTGRPMLAFELMLRP